MGIQPLSQDGLNVYMRDLTKTHGVVALLSLALDKS